MDYKKCDITSLRALAATSSFDDRINVNDLAIPDPDPRKILLHESLDGDEENGFSNGFDDGIIWANFFKGYGCKDFATFVDRFANPAILGTYKTMMKREDRKKFWKTIMNFHNLMKAMLPETGTIDIKETMGKGVTAQLFKEYISLWDNYASTRILGESITSNQAEGGSQAKSRVGYQVSEDIIIADSMLVVAEVNRFIKRLLRLNFANLVEYPEFGYDEEVDIEYKVKRSTIFSNLNSIGYRPKQEDVEDEFDVAVDPVDSNPVPQAGANNFLRELFNETTGGIN
jgi:phage gp29-like protein